MYEWQHKGPAQIHGFLWLKGTPNITKLEWNNLQSVKNAINYLNNYVSSWNHRPTSLQSHIFYQTNVHDPYLLNTKMIRLNNPGTDYKQLFKYVQHHNKKNKIILQTCLWKSRIIFWMLLQSPLVPARKLKSWNRWKWANPNILLIIITA